MREGQLDPEEPPPPPGPSDPIAQLPERPHRHSGGLGLAGSTLARRAARLTLSPEFARAQPALGLLPTLTGPALMKSRVPPPETSDRNILLSEGVVGTASVSGFWETLLILVIQDFQHRVLRV